MDQPKFFDANDLFQESNYRVQKKGLLAKTVKKDFPWENAAKYLEKNFAVKAADLEILKQIFVYGNEAQKVAFERLAKHMGPLVPEDYNNSTQKYYTFGQIAQLLRQEWFHGFLTSEGSVFRLSNLPDNSWLVRFSLREPQAFALSLLYNEKEINHWVVVPTNNPTNGKEVTIPDSSDSPKFSDIYKLVEHYQKHPLPGVGTRLENMCFSLEGKLELGIKLGGGNFGEVFLATWHRQTGPTKVAAKSLQEVKDEKSKNNEKEYDQATQQGQLQGVEIVSFSKEFEAEANLLKNLNHVNVVRFFGVCVMNETQYIVTELMDKGSVISFLTNRKKSDITPLQILGMAKDAAAGMGYLNNKGVVHRDLAARNLLISQPDESKDEFIVKVTDFGLSRKVEKGKYYQKSGKTGDPVKWAAPETFKPQPGKDIFQGRVSERSDRWSYGIVLFELFDLCQNVPYPDLNNSSVKGLLGEKANMVDYLPLKDAPDGLKELMAECLQYNSHDRPEFPVIFSKLEKIESALKADPSKNKWKSLTESKEEKSEEQKIIINDTYDEVDEKEKEYEGQDNEEDN